MSKIIEIKNLNLKFNDFELFHDFSMSINQKSFTTILGPNGSGKSTLVRILTGLIESDAIISVDNLTVDKEHINDIRKIIGVVFSNPDNQFIADTVYDDIAFTLLNLGYDKKTVHDEVISICSDLEITALLDKEALKLSGGEKQLVALACALIHKPKILILDEAFSMIDAITKKKILSKLQDLNKKGLTILNITQDSEECLYGTNIVIINKGKLIINKSLKVAFKNDKTFISNGLELPFMVDLSLKLKYYDLVDEIILDNKALVDKLWK